MEWSKSTISKAELEKKQREYIEAAINMAKRAGNSAQEDVTETEIKAEIVEEIVDEIDDLTGTLEEIAEKADEKDEDHEETAEETEEIGDIKELTEEKDENFGVFNADELVTAIENGEVSGEGLRQAAEILEEMTRKTETMRKLVEEQENKDEDISGSGENYGLNGFINRHNSNCRGCGNEPGTQFSR